MAKGFKDSSGKFHPTGNNGTSSRQKSVRPQGMKLKNEKHKYPFFSLWDTQTDRFLGSGRNQDDLEFTLEDGITFLVEGSPDPEQTEKQSYKMSGLLDGNIKKQIEYLNAFGLKVINHPKEIPDEDDERFVEGQISPSIIVSELGEQDYEEVER